ncbi:Cytochrome P450 [Dillenia turbinata]|uniref:Cytochrome P450 n=1 Tax=Dillenia turbinata TaxID=194707 RepID=A0AAN8VNH0_9MAGN
MGKSLVLNVVEWILHQIRVSDLVLALLGLFIFSSVHHRLTCRGPMIWPIIGTMPSFLFHVNDLYGWTTSVLIKCGGTFRFRGLWMSGSFGIVTADPINIEYMLKINFKNFPKGQYYRERFHDLLGDGIFNSDNQLWKEQRRIATYAMFSTKFADHSFNSTACLVHEKLLKLIKKLAHSGKSFDFQELLLRFTFDHICTAAFGVDPGCLGIDLPSVPFAKAFEDATEFTLNRFLVPPFLWKIMKFFNIGSEKQLRKALQIIQDFAGKTVVDRQVESSKISMLNDRSDLLSRLINHNQDKRELEHGNQFSDKFLKDFCISFILAGRDTSSVALTWFFWLIYKNPEVENRILYEIKQIISRRDSKNQRVLNNVSDIVFRREELEEMIYLQAALSESMRLYPPVPVDFKEAVEDDIFPDGTMVKKKSRVLFSIFAMARMEGIWGKDCLDFKPERWIKEGRFVSENQFKYVVFNAGPRVCLGKKFAYMQMKMVAASIILRYKVVVGHGHHVAPKVTTTLYMKNGLLVTFNPR